MKKEDERNGRASEVLLLVSLTRAVYISEPIHLSYDNASEFMKDVKRLSA